MAASLQVLTSTGINMRSKILITLTSLSVAAYSGNAFAQNSRCAPADKVGNHLVGMIQSLMTPADSTTRNRLGLPLVAPSIVALVSDTTVCARARQAMDSLAHATNPQDPEPASSTAPLYVVSIGDWFGVYERNVGIEEPTLIFFFRSLWDYASVAVM